jgi:hypothetical protein
MIMLNRNFAAYWKLAAMTELERAEPVKRGTWLYAGSVPCEVRIVRHHTLYGSGDHEDPPEIANDREVECFYGLFHTPAGDPPWVSGGAALTLSEAKGMAEAKLGAGLKWHE